MARKKVEPIESLGRDTDKLTVQKSKPLYALWQSELTLAEFKILDTYLARIDSHHPEKRAVVFEKGELEEKLGVKKINQKELEERLKHLMGNVVKIPDGDEKKGFRLVSLFEEAVAEQDDYGLWKVKLECTQKAMKYIFNIEHLGYCRYKLRCITSLTSRYTYIMFIYLEAHRKMKSWEVSLEELKQILNCDKEELYKEFKFFNQKILKRVQKEMHEKTECRYSYEPIKKGRSVVAIRFTLATIKEIFDDEVDENQMTIEQWQEEAGKEKELWRKPLEAFNFTPEQYDELFSLLVTLPDARLPQSSASCNGSIDLMRYHYIKQKAMEIKRRDKEKPIRSKFSYLRKLIKQDAGESPDFPPEDKKKAGSKGFGDYTQTTTDETIEEFEKLFLDETNT